jgi:hypothetical protein
MKCQQIVFVASCLSFLLSCGKEGGLEKKSEKSLPSNEWAEMETKVPTEVPFILSAYEVHGSNEAAFAAFYSGGRYAVGYIYQVSPKFFRAASTIGHYLLNGNQIEREAVKTTCPAMHEESQRQPGIFLGRPGDNYISFHRAALSVLFKRYFSAGRDGEGSVVEWGCFDGAGNFSSHDWVNL